jgi:hypothetical protein
MPEPDESEQVDRQQQHEDSQQQPEQPPMPIPPEIILVHHCRVNPIDDTTTEPEQPDSEN